MSKKDMRSIAIIVVLIFMATIFVYPLIFSPDQPTELPEEEISTEEGYSNP